MVLVRVRDNDIFQLSIGHILVQIFADGGNTGGFGTRVNENIGLAGFDIGAVAGIFVAKLQEVNLQFAFHQYPGRFVAFELFGADETAAKEPDGTARRQAGNGQKQRQRNRKLLILRHFCRPPHLNSP